MSAWPQAGINKDGWGGGAGVRRRVDRRRVLLGTVTPLASIFGSGFLIIVPVLARTLGVLSVVGAAGVCALAWVAGTAIRHCVRVVEPRTAAGELDRGTHRLDRLADAVIVIAYVISVALYLRILAQYVFHLFGDGSPVGERVLAAAIVGVIAGIGIVWGFQGLDVLDRVALIGVLVLVTVLIVVLAYHDIHTWAQGGLRRPPSPPADPVRALLTLGGVVITVQGFETVRYLGDQYDTETRVQASRVAQLVATVIYVALVAVATPVMGLGSNAGADTTLLEIIRRVVPLLAGPLVIIAVLSQLSAATADTVAAEGNLAGLTDWMRGARPYLISAAAAIALAATVSTFAIVALASRAFAAYYGLQALMALRTSTGSARKAGYAVLAVVMFDITALAQPAG